MIRLRISNDGECILIRQGTTVIVVDAKQAESVAATIVLEYERMANQEHRDDQRRMQAFDSECRAFHAVYVPPNNGHTSRTIEADGNDEFRADSGEG